MRAVTAEEMAEIDRIAIEEVGIPGVVLMENAGRGAVGKPAAAPGILGVDRAELLSLDQLLATPRGCEAGSAHGLDGYRDGRTGHARRNPRPPPSGGNG